MICVIWLSLPPRAAAQESEKSVAETFTEATGVNWRPGVKHARLVLTVLGPDGKVYRKEFEPGSRPFFKIADGKGGRRADGHYTYELRVIPVVTAAPAMRRKSRGGAATMARSRKSRGRPVRLTTKATVQSGTFLVNQGEWSQAMRGKVRADRTPPPLLTTR